MRPGIAVWDKYVHVTWFDRRDSKGILDWDIYCKRSTDRGTTWEEDIRMTHTPHHTRHPQIVTTSGGRVCCIWEDGQRYDGTRWFGDARLFASVSDDHGQTWNDPERLTFINAPHSWATHPKSYACGSRIHLAWTDSPEGPNSRQAAYYMTSADGGVSWESPEQLLLATEANPRETWAQGIAGTESYAVALISTPSGLHYRRRDLASGPDGNEPQ